MSTGAIQKPKQKVDFLMQSLLERKQSFQSLLPEGLKAEWFFAEVRVAVARAPKLADCTPLSVVDALTTCAQLGLSPSGRLGSAYRLPYKDKCPLVIGYRGYADLAYRSGDVASFHAQVVRTKDVWQYEEGLSPVLRHIPSEEQDARGQGRGRRPARLPNRPHEGRQHGARRHAAAGGPRHQGAQPLQ